MAFGIKTRRLGILLLTFCLLAGALSAPASAVSVSDFKDIAPGSWYYDAVSFAVEKGLFNGISADTFAPGGTITRGMFITVLGRYAGVDPEAWCAAAVTGDGIPLRSGAGKSYSKLATLNKSDTVTILGETGGWYCVRAGGKTGYVNADKVEPKYHVFLDVDYSSYYAGYAIWGFEKGIVNGMGSADIYAPEDYVTREQICKLLKGYADAAGLTLTEKTSTVVFTDKADISSWAAEGVAAMQRAGVVVGENEGGSFRFRPGSYATRAEAATIFQRFYDASGGGGGEPDSSRAVILSEKITVPASVVRVGILANTKSYRYAVQTVKLVNTTGDSFQYGSFSDSRKFTKAGTISSSAITVTSNGSVFTVKNASGTVVYTGSGALAIHPVSSGKALTRVNGNYRFYGDFELRQASGASGYITVINYVGVEDYVKGVLPYEFSVSWPAEALKAAAVAARNVVMSASWSVYAPYGFDVMANTVLQLYRGRGSELSESYFAPTDAAVDATKGLYLTYDDGGTRRLCNCTYFSSDGGATEDSAHVFGMDYSYLMGKKDPYEAAAAEMIGSSYELKVTISRTGSAMTTIAARAGLGGASVAKDGIRIETYPATGNVKSIILTGTNGATATIDQKSSYSRWDFLSGFGYSGYSYNFEVKYNEADDTFTCTRHGWGHNVGMSAWGCYAMAQYYGKDYRDILGFYYSGTSLQHGKTS